MFLTFPGELYELSNAFERQNSNGTYKHGCGTGTEVSEMVSLSGKGLQESVSEIATPSRGLNIWVRPLRPLFNSSPLPLLSAKFVRAPAVKSIPRRAASCEVVPTIGLSSKMYGLLITCALRVKRWDPLRSFWILRGRPSISNIITLKITTRTIVSQWDSGLAMMIT